MLRRCAEVWGGLLLYSVSAWSVGTASNADEHVTNCVTRDGYAHIMQSFRLMCWANAYPDGKVRVFTEPSLSAEYLGGVGNAPPDYLDMSVENLVTTDNAHFLCGPASNANGYPVVRNLTENGETTVAAK
ncbi:MAG: hypothetical protein AAF393_07315 [Pseudomonadota bacterium]